MDTPPVIHFLNDGEDDRGGNSDSCSCSTNWIVAAGSLDASFSFESSDSPICGSDAVDSTPKAPLILKSPSPDAGPCEIKICFRRRYEVLQIYVRSSASVYEVYCSPSAQSDSNYLCTVRCCVAVRDGEVLKAIDITEAFSHHAEKTVGQLAEVKRTHQDSNVTIKDDWVEIKVPAHVLGVKSSLLKKPESDTGQCIQDFHESTAEISDSDPCTSLTLRLLSLQHKSCLIIDEIYVFADPIETSDERNQTAQGGNAAGSSFLSVLVPTLLQMSESDVCQKDDKHSSCATGKEENLKMALQTSNSPIASNQNPLVECLETTNWEGAKTLEADGPTEAGPPKISIPLKTLEADGATEVEPPEISIPLKTLEADGPTEAAPPKISTPSQTSGVVSNVGYDLKFVQVECFLEQLVSRVSRIEDLFLRFEEKILKPINSIEARLQRVEQQLEHLSNNSMYSGLQPCIKISAPPFPSSDSNFSSLYDEGCEVFGQKASELKDDNSSNSYNSFRDTKVPTSTQLLPTLIVSAPHFSSGEDEEENEVAELSPDIKLKPALSIDDACAAALAGFMFTAAVETPTFNQALRVRAPEFTSEENVDNEHSECIQTLVPSSAECPTGDYNNDKHSKHDQTSEDEFIQNASAEITARKFDSFFQPVEIKDAEHLHHFVSTSSDTTKLECARKDIELCGDSHSIKTSEIEEKDNNSEEGSISFHIQERKDDTVGKDNCQSTEDAKEETCGSVNGKSDVTFSGENIIREHLQDDANDSPNTTLEGVTTCSSGAAVEGSHNTSNSIHETTCPSSLIDFKLPILDVKFISCGSSSTLLSLEALLGNTDKSAIEVFDQPEYEQMPVESQGSLIPVDHGELVDFPSNSQSLLGLHGCDLGEVILDDGGLECPCPSSNQDVVSSLI